MPVPLVTQHYPDDFQILNFYVNHAVVPAANDAIPLFYADRNMVVDSIVYGVAVAETGSSDTVELVHATTPQATTGTSIQSAASSINTAGTVTPTISTSGNEVASGRWVIAKFSDALGQFHGTIQVRFRSRLA
jgi:hypothetical protein